MERERERENDINVNVEVIQWEVYVEEVVRIWSLRSSVETATAKRGDLFVKLDAKLQVRKESLSRSDEVEAMYRKLELQRQRLACSLLSLKEMSQEVQDREEKLATLVQSLSGAAKSLSAAHGRLQEANKLLAEGGNGQLWHLKKMLLTRQQLMVTQVSSLYPIARGAEPKSGEGSGSSPVSTCTDSPVESLTIGGLQLFGPPLKKLGFFNDKQEFQSSATALGYVAHIIKLIASYLDIPLRYPLRLGGSRSYIQDYASLVEPSINEQEGTLGMDFLQKHVVEFPLFSEGQEPTRSAYAVFLLNKGTYIKLTRLHLLQVWTLQVSRGLA
ncbi:vacuolar protein sorting 38 isoform X2 [Cryptomeria japonica]|uniref:vacuolar protein sorting 38 isoform X2 n=1 Tax=Cryptomeria japonica TaxID=3369 RepID=UPI0025ACB83A|nr:vacuolar protein sorting 38 isoform X2 [Cryptomeria japonica]